MSDGHNGHPDGAGGGTRDRLIAAARGLFLEHGFTATSVAMILKAAEARSGSLYHYFPTKEDLLLAVLESYKPMVRAGLAGPVFERVSDPIERIFGVLDAHRTIMQGNGCRQGCPIGNLALELSDTHPNVRSVIIENFCAWQDLVRECLDEAADRLPAGMSTADLSSFVLTVMEGAVMQAKAHRAIDPFDTAIAMLRDYFDRLLADARAWDMSHTSSESDNNVGADT